MSFTHIPPQAELSQAAQLQKLTQFQQMQQMSNFSPQIPQRGLNHPAMLAQQPPAPQAQVPQAQLIIKEVWAVNLHKELQTIRQLITSYNYVSFSTEFPGILARPIGVFSSTDDYHYQTLRTNADLLDLIQFGVSLTDANGNASAFLIGGANRTPRTYDVSVVPLAGTPYAAACVQRQVLTGGDRTTIMLSRRPVRRRPGWKTGRSLKICAPCARED